jgi:tetratricopeptide (TPR) repeat protein
MTALGQAAKSVKLRQRSAAASAEVQPRSPRLFIRETKTATAGRSAAPVEERRGMFGGQPQKPSLLQRAQEALAAHNADKAESILVPHLAKHPRDTAAYMLLGEAAVARRNWREAMEIFEQVVVINPRTKGAYAALGRAAYEAGKFTRAIEALQRAHDAQPQDRKVLKQLLRIARRMDNVPMQHSLQEELRALKATGKQSELSQQVPTH